MTSPHATSTVPGALLILFVVGCQPTVEMRDATPWDGGVLDGAAQESGGMDVARTDIRYRDRLVDTAGNDRATLRDVAGQDLAMGPVLDAAGHDGWVPQPGTQACQEWTQCAPHYDSRNSGYDCVNNLCVCDGYNQWVTACLNINGIWLGQECFCETRASTPPPAYDAGDDEYCWWTWVQLPCDPDRWVDTSYQDYQCRCCDVDGYDICDWVWVDDGYWEDGYCPPGRWEESCY